MAESSSIDLKPSAIWLPADQTFPLVFDFLCQQFPGVEPSIWSKRLEQGKVSFENGDPINLQTVYQPNRRVLYYREVEQEQIVPFREKVLYQDDNIIVADKPHFLAVHPAGQYINETLQNRLKLTTGEQELNAAHRIDRLTAGLVLFTRRKENRGLYQRLFMEGKVRKVYEAVAGLPTDGQKRWHLQSRIVASEPWFMMQEVAGEPNAESHIQLLSVNGEQALYELRPHTGKKHQLRLHMCQVAGGILYDQFYPVLQGEQPDDYNRPLQLLARSLEFLDPVTGKQHFFRSERTLCGSL